MEQLKAHKFPVSVNPLGVLFNPLSIADSLQRLLHPRPLTEDSLFFHGPYRLEINVYAFSLYGIPYELVYV